MASVPLEDMTHELDAAENKPKLVVFHGDPEYKETRIRRVFKGNRISSAGKFAMKKFRATWQFFKYPASNYKPYFFDRFAAVIGEPIKYFACYSMIPAGFINAMISLRYSKEREGYLF